MILRWLQFKCEIHKAWKFLQSAGATFVFGKSSLEHCGASESHSLIGIRANLIKLTTRRIDVEAMARRSHSDQIPKTSTLFLFFIR